MALFSPKQRQTLIESYARINIWEGAVRSGKSYASLWRWLKYIQEAPEGNLVMIGRTATTIKHNLVDEICDLIGTDAKYYSGKNELNLWGKRIYLVGASDERAETKIRGSTFAGAYIDEITLIPESFFIMLLSRISIPNAKIFATTNPDSPYHWLKVNYIDRQDELDLKLWKFKLEDNPSLTDDFKANLRSEYRGLWFRRYIDGEWCLAEGTIYDFFDSKLHCIDFPPGQGKEYYVGVDYGTTNPTAFVLVAYNNMHYPNYWIEKEYYYDSSKHNRQKTNSEYAEDLKNFIGDIPVKQIYIDPSAASFKLECQRNGIRNILDAENEVLDGIRFVASMFNNGSLKICKACVNLIHEMGSYVWDPKSKDQGVDKPLKQNDHCFAEGTQIAMAFGQRSIEQMTIGDMVVTPLGLKYVINVFCHEEDVYEFEILGRKMQCTKDHKFFTGRGWIESFDLIQSDMFLINLGEETCLNQTSLYLTELNIENIQNPKLLPIETIIGRINQIALKDMDICIETFGSSIMEKYPKDIIFITSMEMPKTMTLATLNLLNLANIYPIIWEIVDRIKYSDLEITAIEYARLQRNGINLVKEINGIKNTESNHINKEYRKNISVNVAEHNSNPQNTQTQNFVRITVNHNGEEIITLMMSLEHAKDAIKNLALISIQTLDTAQKLVARKHIGKQNVYNLEIEDIPVFYANNILVHNCNDALRYALYTRWGKMAGQENRMSKEKLEDMRRQAFYE